MSASTTVNAINASTRSTRMGLTEKAKRVTTTLRDAITQRSISAAATQATPRDFNELLDASTLESKETVMRTMHLVPVPICAAYLGVMEDDIYRFKRGIGAGFGGTYCQSLCFSLNEMSYFARNRDWFTRANGERYAADFSIPPVTFLLDGTFVCTSMMLGYLAVDHRAKCGNLHIRENCRREYRLSDIRKEFVKQFPLGLAQKTKMAVASSASVTKHITGDAH